MGQNWSKSRNRAKAIEARRAEAMLARELADDQPQPSKEQLRADAAEALARYRGPIRRLPTMIQLKCYRCNHRGRARVDPGSKARFVCSKCGARSI